MKYTYKENINLNISEFPLQHFYSKLKWFTLVIIVAIARSRIRVREGVRPQAEPG